MITTATIETDKAERLMKALCNHFARKINAGYEGDKGYIEFKDGKCEVLATSSTLTLKVEAENNEGLLHIRQVVLNHLLRFTPEQEIQVDWKDS